MRFLPFSAIGLALLVTAADAAPRPVDVPRPTIPAPTTPDDASTVNDSVVALRSQVNALKDRMKGMESRVLTLEELVRRMDARTSFRCVNEATSQNGAGTTEDCGAYKCNPLDGRCRVSARDSVHCVSPNVLWPGGICAPQSIKDE